MSFLTHFPLRITLPVFLFLTALILLIFSMQSDIRNANSHLEEEIVSELIQDMTLLQGVLNNLSRKGDVEGIQAVFADVGAEPHITIALLIDKENRILNSNDMRLIGKPVKESLPDIDMQALSDYRKNIRGKVSLSSSGDFVYGYYPVVLSAQMEGLNPSSMGILHMRYDLTGLKADSKYEILQHMFQDAIYYTLVFFLLGLFLYFIVSKRASLLVSVARKISSGDVSARANIGGRDELFSIASAFNQMVEQLQNNQRILSESKMKADASNKAKSQFLANVSHDIRTPMHAIMGFSSMLKMMNVGEEEHKIIEIINQKSKILMALIDDLLDISRVESGKIILRSDLINLKELVDGMVDNAKVELGNKDIKIISEYRCEIESVKGDYLRLGQIISNILNNALKYTDNGEIIVSTESALSQKEPNKCHIKLTVKDTGLGISKDNLDKIFDPFTRIHEFEGGKARKGSGLGLYIVKTLIDIMGGKITATSEIGVGSTFSIELHLERGVSV